MMVEEKYKRKGQAFSTEIVVVIVLLLVGVLYLVVNQIDSGGSNDRLEQRYADASFQAGLVYERLKETEIIDSMNNVNIERLLSLDEASLKEELGLSGDFAIAFEKGGRLIMIDPQNEIGCLGSDKIRINGRPCV